MSHASYSDDPEMEKTDYTVDDLSNQTVLDTVYPKSIIETRYNGTYSGGKWAALANTMNPRDTNAFGSDIPCGEFWRNGPKHEINGEKVYAVAHDTPEKALQLLADVIRDDMDDENVVTVKDDLMGEVTGYYEPETNTFTASGKLTASKEGEE